MSATVERAFDYEQLTALLGLEPAETFDEQVAVLRERRAGCLEDAQACVRSRLGSLSQRMRSRMLVLAEASLIEEALRAAGLALEDPDEEPGSPAGGSA